MSDNLNNEIKKPLFYDGSLTITTSGGDITPTLIQTAQSTGQEKYNLDQRDQLAIILYALTGTVTAGTTLTVKYYNRVPNPITNAILLATETKTLAAITVGNYLSTDFTDAALELADYFTIECTLKQAVGTSYVITGNVIVKKKNNLAYQNEDVTFDNVTITGDLSVTGDMSLDDITSDTINVNSIIIDDLLELPKLTPVNAVAADIGAMTIVSRPDDYVANVNAYEDFEVKALSLINIQSSKEITLNNIPKTLVNNVYATGNITCTTPYPSVDETFEFAGETFTFKAARGGANEVTIGATDTDQGAAVAFAINTDTAHSATNNAGVVALVSTTPGTGGNALTLTSALAGIIVSPLSGHLEGGIDAVVADTIKFDAGGSSFTFVTGTPGANEIQIGIDVPLSVANIIATTPDTANYTLAAGSTTSKFKIIATAAGTAGDGITSSQTGTSFTGVGATAGGQNADQIVFDVGGADETTYTFIANGLTPGVNEICIGATANAAGYAEQCANIVATGDGATRYTIHASTIPDALFKIKTTIVGTAGDGDVSTTVDGTRIDPVGTGVVSGGVDEVKSYLTIADINYIFSSTTGDDPSTVYPAAYDVRTAAAATMEQIAAALVVGLEADTDTFTASEVSNTGAVITAPYKTKGVIGNDITCENHLVTAGDITSARFTAGLMAGGTDGTPGYKGQAFYDASTRELWYCDVDDYTITQYNWHNTSQLASVIAALALKANLSGAVFSGSIEVPGLVNTGYYKNVVRELTDDANSATTDSNVVFTITSAKTYTLAIPSASEYDNHQIEVVNDVSSTGVLSVGAIGTLYPGDVGLIRYKPGVGWKLRKQINKEIYCFLSIVANQGSNLTAGNHVEFDTMSGDTNYFTLATGAGQADGLLTVKYAGTYDIEIGMFAAYGASTHGSRYRVNEYAGGTQIAAGRCIVIPEGSASFSKLNGVLKTSAVLTAGQVVMLDCDSVISTAPTALLGYGTAGSDNQSCYMSLKLRRS